MLIIANNECQKNTRTILRGGLAPPAPEIDLSTTTFWKSHSCPENAQDLILKILVLALWINWKPSKPIRGGPYPPPTWSTTSRTPEIDLPNIPVFRDFRVSVFSLTTRSVTSRGSTPLKIIIYDLLYRDIAEIFFQRSIPLAHTSDRLSNSPRRVI